MFGPARAGRNGFASRPECRANPVAEQADQLATGAGRLQPASGPTRRGS